MEVLDGVNLILSIGGKALAFSTGCKISTQTEVGERQTKESAAGKWPEKYAKKFSEDISADGLTCVNPDGDAPSYDQLKEMQLSGMPVEASYSVREGDGREGKTAGGYQGRYLITSLELDGQANDDSKYSVKLESHGEVKRIGAGLSGGTGTQAAQAEGAQAAQAESVEPVEADSAQATKAKK